MVADPTNVRLFALLLATAVGWSCAAGADNDTASSGSDASSSAAGGAGGQGGAQSASSSTIVTVATGAGGGSAAITEVFGHGPDNLYRLDPTTNELTWVGMFQNCGKVLDIAIDGDGKMYGTSFDGLYTIDPETAACTQIAPGQYPNSLSFVPAGTLDASVEALVGYNDKDYVRIDISSGALTVVNANALTGNYVSSGDIVSVINGGTYLTIKESPVNENGCNDCIVEVNPATGAVTTNFGSVGFDRVFGLAYWGGSAYGFNKDGVLFEITFDGATVTTTPIPIPSAPMDLEFWGAGSSTSVPVIPIN